VKCAEIMNRNVEWLDENDSVLKAATVMAEAGVGFLPICDSRRRVVGVVTDRDLATRVVARNLDPATMSMASIMSAPPITCLESTDVRDAEDLMAVECRARLVVTNAEAELIGVVSVADIIELAPGRGALETIRAVMWREALGARAGAPKGQPLLKDDPIAQNQPVPEHRPQGDPTVFTGGHHPIDTREFPVDR
jgi:CBS domain-containing protein